MPAHTLSRRSFGATLAGVVGVTGQPRRRRSGRRRPRPVPTAVGRRGPGAAGWAAAPTSSSSFQASYAAALTDLEARLFTSGTAAEILRTRAAVLTAQASDLISADTVTTESAAIGAHFA